MHLSIWAWCWSSSTAGYYNTEILGALEMLLIMQHMKKKQTANIRDTKFLALERRNGQLLQEKEETCLSIHLNRIRRKWLINGKSI